MIIDGKTYFIPAHPDTVFLASKTPNNGVALVDLNRTKRWGQAGFGESQGHFQEYRLVGERLIFTQGDIIDYQSIEKKEAPRPDARLVDVRPCDYKTLVIDLMEWSPNCKEKTD